VKAFEAIGLVIVLGITVAALSLVMAFPFMWAWNYAMTSVFGLPKIGWLTSFCLLWVSHQVLPKNVIQKG
jgi:hypothetical protein